MSQVPWHTAHAPWHMSHVPWHITNAPSYHPGPIFAVPLAGV
jgi:hypothetical protein